MTGITKIWTEVSKTFSNCVALNIRLQWTRKQGCQMVYFQTKNQNSGEFWRVYDGKMLMHILRPIGIFYGHLGYFMTFRYIFPILVSWTKKNLATLLANGLKILWFLTHVVN
jgi:hypothetical protein